MARAMSLVLLAGVLLAAVGASAQQGQQPHPLSNLPPPGSIITGFFFPDHPTKKFQAGDTVKTVLGVRNDADDLYNITAILGSLNMVSDFRLYVQNFTEQVYHQPVQAGQEVSFEYKFATDARIPTLGTDSFTLALTVVYQDSKGQFFSNTFFNQTVSVLEVKKLIDWELISLFLILGGLLAGAGYVAYVFAAPHLHTMGVVRKSRKSKKVEAPTAEHQEDWVKGTNYDNFQKRKAASKKAAE